MKTHSLARQTLLIVLTAQIFCAFALSGFTLLREAHAHLRAFDVRLQGRSDSLLGTIQDAEDANSTVRIDPAELKVPANDVFAVYNQGGALLGSSAEAPPALVERGHDGYRDRARTWYSLPGTAAGRTACDRSRRVRRRWADATGDHPLCVT